MNINSDNSIVKYCTGSGQTGKALSHITWEEIVLLAEDPANVPKENAQYFIPSDLLSRNHSKQKREGRFTDLVGDLDKCRGMPFEDVSRAVVDAIGGAEWNHLIYTTKSAVELNPKARFILPLAVSLDAESFVLCQKILNDRLTNAGITPDRSNERAGQIFFLPNKGEYYASFSWDMGENLNPLIQWADEIKAERDAQEAAQMARAAQQEESKAKATGSTSKWTD